MKYNVGDKTLLGEITDRYQKIAGDWLYYIGGRLDGSWYTESEIDAIIIKPKRNIDAVMDMWDKGNREDAIDFFRDHVRHMSTYEDIVALREPYVEPSHYPKLTPKELRAVKWLVEGGFTEIIKDHIDVGVYCRGFKAWIIIHSPIAECLCMAKWIKSEPINLAELLAAQEEK